MPDPVVLELPEPPSPNEVSRSTYAHPAQGVRLKNAYKRKCWTRAMSQVTPTTDPPEKVVVKGHFRLHNLRDEDNLSASLKYVLDALRCPQEGEDVRWRQGLAERKGYLRDDAPPNCAVLRPTQEIDRDDRGLTLKIIPAESS